MQPVCIIVDGYKFSRAYVAACRQKCIQCIHVFSTPTPIKRIESVSTWSASDYLKNFYYSGDLPTLIGKLQLFDIKAVIAGTEPGIELADKLAFHFKCLHNGMECTVARRDKFEMTEVLRAQGIPTVKYFKSINPLFILDWVKSNTTWPVVIKPLKSAGTDGVRICTSPTQLLSHCNTILQMENKFGETNKEILVQSFLKGIEYVVNTVSLDEQHYVTDIWKCKKRHNDQVDTMLYEKETLLPHKGDIQNKLINYIEKVLSALQIRYGAAHAEIMMTEEGPILIEVGARIMGNLNLGAHNICLGHNQLELNVDAYLDPKAFRDKTRIPYQLKKNTSLVILLSTQEGIVKSIPIEEIIKKLPSFYDISLYVKPGEYLCKTFDLQSVPGKVMLVHDDSEIIEYDYQKIMAAEPKGFIVERC